MGHCFSSKKRKIQMKSNSFNESRTHSESENHSYYRKRNPSFGTKTYGIRKFGVLIQPDQLLLLPLTFHFHLSKFRCKMLNEEKLYILQIIFDKVEYDLSFAYGYNPKFSLDQSIKKEILYQKMEETFMEIAIYSHPIVNNIDEFKTKDRSTIINESTLYSSLKIDLLTIAIAPMHHDIVLRDPKKSHIQIGRINYDISCSHIENISFEIESLNFQLNSLIKNQLSLKMKFKNPFGQWETNHSKEIFSKPIPKEEITLYEYTPTNPNENNLKLEGKMSMRGLRNTEGVLNIYSTRLIDKKSSIKIDAKEIQKYLNIHSLPNANISNNNIELINSYSVVGYVKLNFYKILSENDNLIVKQTSKFFMSMSNKINENSNPTNKKKTNTDESMRIKEEMKFQVFETICKNYSETIYSHGTSIGKIDMKIKITNVPLIRQIMCGVMTETGFEINSIFLYENDRLNIQNNKKGDMSMSSLPSDLQKLIELKNILESEISNRTQLKAYNTDKDFNSHILKYFNGIKECLGKSIEEGCLYYGYSSNKDLYQGQAVMLELGLNILEFIDRITMEQRVCCFEIIKLICERSEFDLGTLTLKWFMDKKEKKSHIEFKDDFLITNKIIENFIRLNNESIRLSLEGIEKGRNIDNDTKNFITYYLSVAYFRTPQYRDAFIKTISPDKANDNITKLITNKGIVSVDELMEKDPINSLILWDNLFYKKLNSSLEHTSKENEIKEQLIEMEEIISYSSNRNKSGWKEKIAKRDFIFFDLVISLAQFVQNKISISSDINWLNIPGFDAIFIAIDNELTTLEVKNYPKNLMYMIPLFLSNIAIINVFISHVIQRTNAYDNKAVFNMLSIANYLFKQSEIFQNRENYFEGKFDYSTLQLAFKIIITTDNSLSIAKFIWLYYKNAHLMSMNHICDIINVIFLPYFFYFFFHWSWPVRNSFYFLLLYIFNFRLKGKIMLNDNERSVSTFYKPHTIKGGQYSSNEIDLYNSNDIFDRKMGVVRVLQNIIYTEELDPSFNCVVDETKFGNVIESIPEGFRNNIVIAMHHFDNVNKDFNEWKKENGKNVLSIEYPEMEITTPKEDVVEYTSDF